MAQPTPAQRMEHVTLWIISSIGSSPCFDFC